MELVAIAWVDRNRYFFVTTMFRLGKGEMIQRKRLHQLDKSGRAPPDKVIIEVAQPKAITKYCEVQRRPHHQPTQPNSCQ